LAETIIGLYKAELIHRRAVEDPRRPRGGHRLVGVLVQSPAAVRPARRHPARRIRAELAGRPDAMSLPAPASLRPVLAAVKAKPCGRPAAGLDSRCGPGV